jgi:hypothetical protein
MPFAHKTLNGIPGNIYVYKELIDFFEDYDINYIKKKFINSGECPESQIESWLWYIYKTLCKQNLTYTKNYLRLLVNLVQNFVQPFEV